MVLPALELDAQLACVRWIVTTQPGGWLAVCEQHGITTEAETLEALGPMMADALQCAIG